MIKLRRLHHVQGDASEELLRAHARATAAAEGGVKAARWPAAATLDQARDWLEAALARWADDPSPAER